MKTLEKADKQQIKLRYATALAKAMGDSPLSSFRKLAKEAGMEPAHIQKIATGKLDVAVTTSVAIAAALGISYAALAAYYDQVTEKDIADYVVLLQKQQAIRGKKK